ncbi:MAG: T9SS type A sorting domain-containing protein [Ignavibacteria bacterium]|nr:T9SS type A sorting domain-containing protein [Ignavibacteria bacterium]
MEQLRTTKTRLLFGGLIILGMTALSGQSEASELRHVRDFIGLWMGVSHDDGSFFKVAITDDDGDGVAEVIMHDTFWSICTELNGLTGMESTLVPSLVTGPGSIDSVGNLSVALTIQCRDEQNVDLGPPIGPLPVTFVVQGKNHLELSTGMFDPSPVFRVSDGRNQNPGHADIRDLIGLWMGVSHDDGSFFKVAITDNDGDGVAEVIMHDTFWSICTELNGLTGMEATLVPALVTGPGTLEAGNLNVDLTIQCRDELNADLGTPIGPLPVTFVSKGKNLLELTTGMFEPSPVFRVSLPGGYGTDNPVAAMDDGVGLSSGDGYSSTLEVPQDFRLEQNYPNPFNPTTTIAYALPHAAHVTLKVFNMVGEEVSVLRDGWSEAGHHSVMFQTKGLPSGVYAYRLQTDEFVATKKLMVLK